MLAKGACKATPWLSESALPFLYCTSTIRLGPFSRRSYSRGSRGTAVARRDGGDELAVSSANEQLPQGADPFERTPGQRRSRRIAARETGWKKLDLETGADGGDGGGARDALGLIDGPQRWRKEKKQGNAARRKARRPDSFIPPPVARDAGAYDDAQRSRLHNRALDNEPDSERAMSSERIDHVPFENLNLNRGEALEIDAEDSTITPSERKAFEKLFSIKKHQTDAEAKAVPKTSNDAKEEDLDAILEAALAPRRERPTPEFPAALRSMAEEAKKARKQKVQTNARDREEAYRQRAIKHDLDHITASMNAAETDIALWHVLETRVLNRLVATRIDPLSTPKHHTAADNWARLLKSERSVHNVAEPTKPRAPVSDLLTLTANLPAHLLHYINLLTTSFPASHLPLTVLPYLKSLGPASFALGTTTALYNAHLRILYTQYGPHALKPMAETLREMDREVYDFDAETQTIINLAIKDARRYRLGFGGPGLEVVWKSQGVSAAVKGLIGWREIVEGKRQEGALRKARGDELDMEDVEEAYAEMA